jgi:tRNA 2-thiouridine synthesizing protein A
MNTVNSEARTAGGDDVVEDFAIDLDVRGLNCPLPILRTKKALAGMQTGQQIRVRATDPGSVIDFPAFCRHSGNVFVRHTEADGVFEFVLRRK